MRFVWRKLSRTEWEDSWIERLAFLQQRLAVTRLGRGRTVRLEAFGLSKKEATLLKNVFGGDTRPLTQVWNPSRVHKAHLLRIRNKLLIASQIHDSKTRRLNQRVIILIPPETAFGTGAHPTTAGCLRFLCDIAQKLPRPWELLDLGTGSGILAIAAEKLGAAACLATDFDPQAIRIARKNVRLNRCRKIKVQQLDVTRWKPRRRWNVITANIYHSVLINSADTVARACADGGRAIFSGVLREQERECLRALNRFFLINELRRNGKWVTMMATPR
jgi:ribosomal protein L11 methyltransferase